MYHGKGLPFTVGLATHLPRPPPSCTSFWQGLVLGALVASGYAAQLTAFPPLPEEPFECFLTAGRSSKQLQHPVSPGNFPEGHRMPS
jgi:hypothetical protein